MLSTIQIRKLSMLNLKGHGGKERVLSSILDGVDGWKRSSHSLYDYKNDILGCLVECKKQVNLQWLDPSKYYSITEEQANIYLFFIVINKLGYIDLVFSVKTKDFIQRFWSIDHVRDAYEYKSKYPKDQIKSSLKTRKFYLENKDIVSTIYDRRIFSLGVENVEPERENVGC